MFIFRADGNENIGSGHIMRCLSVAVEARDRGEDCVFVVADRAFVELINNKGFETVVLHTAYDDMPQELDVFRRLISIRKVTAVIIDSYYVTEEYLREIYDLCQEMLINLLYIDDVLSFAYPCMILVNYNIYGESSRGTYNRMYDVANVVRPIMLLGPAYVPLRTEFSNIERYSIRTEGKNILVSTGGADPFHLALRIVKLLTVGLQDFEDESVRDLPLHAFHIIVGAMNPDRDEIRRTIQDIGNVVIHEQVTDMVSLMQSADVAISAAGSTLYELCAIGVPTVTYTFADNQLPGAKEFAKQEIMQYIGDVREVDDVGEFTRSLISSAVSICDDVERRQKMADDMIRIVDGQGAGRIVDSIHAYQLTMKELYKDNTTE